MNTLQPSLFDGIFTRLFKRIYIVTSKKPLPKNLSFPKELSDFFDTLYSAYGLSYMMSDTKFGLNNLIKPSKNNDVFVAFSGGKDSVACVIKLRKEGYNPVLFFVKGINKSYSQEYDIAKVLSKKLSCDFVEYSVSIGGKKEYIEHPIKNQLILAAMVDEGVKRNIHNFAFGSTLKDTLDVISNEYMLSDGYEMFLSVSSFYKKFIPDFNMLIPLKNETESLCLIAEYDKSLIDYTYSCMLPIRYKGNIVKKNQQKFDMVLLPNRCGSCYKCCFEFIVLNLIGVVDYSPEFISHCWVVLDKFADEARKTVSDKEKTEALPWIDEKIVAKFKKAKLV